MTDASSTPPHGADLGAAGTDRAAQARRAFRELHREGTFVLPNPWDAGSARLLESMGFLAVATTSSGFAATLGRGDQELTRDELVAHVAGLAAAVRIPVAVDAERGYATDAAGVAETAELLADAGASGISIEDWDPEAKGIDDLGAAVERITAAAEVCDRHGMVLTARCENHLYGHDDLDDTIERLRAYHAAGAGAVYAPGLTAVPDILRVVTEVDAPVNVLALPDAPAVPVLARIGVRRVSTGGALTWAAYGALVDAARELLTAGTSTYLSRALSGSARAGAFTATR
jgi:2-methylisocitrate lyase-like PEP mutase family enzyme